MTIKNFFSSFFGMNNKMSKYYVSMLFSGKTTEWISTDGRELETYYEIPELALVVNRRASMKSNAVIKHMRDGEVWEESPITKFLNKPNVLQSRNEFLSQRDIQRSLFGNAYTYMVIGNRESISMGVPPAALWNLPASVAEIKRTGKMFKQTKKEDIIEKFYLNLNGKQQEYEYDLIWHSNDVNPSDPLVGSSRLRSLEKPLSNIKLSYAHRNTIMAKKGALGMLSPDVGKGEAAAIGMSKDERRRIEKEYQSAYSTTDKSKMQVLIAENAMKWTPISYPTKDLMLFEEVDADRRVVIDTFGLNDNLFSKEKGTTFTNLYEGIKMAYQDTIIPEAEDDAKSLTEFFGMDGEREKLIYDYSHIPALAEDGNEKAETLKKKAEACEKLINSGVMTLEEIREVFPVDELREYL